VTITNTSFSLTDPVTITVITDELWRDLNGNGNPEAEEVTTIDITDPLDPNLVSTTCDSLVGTVLAPGAATTCTFSVFIIGNPWEDPLDTVTVTAEDDEGTEASASDDAQVNILQINQRSLDIVALTASRPIATIITGAYTITNASDDPLLDVLIETISVTFELRSQGQWVPITGYTCQFWLDTNGNGSVDSGEPLIDPDNTGIVFDTAVTILYECTRTAGWPNRVRITAHATINGRPGMDFRFRDTFLF